MKWQTHKEYQGIIFEKKNIDIINKILLKECTTKLNIIRLHKIMSNDKKLKLVPDEEYKYGVLTNLNSKEKRIKYTDRPVMDVYSEPKVLMSYALNLYPIYDDCLSPTEHVFYQIVKDKKNGLKLINYLESKWIGYQTDHKIFNYLPDITNDIKNITDKEIYMFFDLTKKEIKRIEDMIK